MTNGVTKVLPSLPCDPECDLYYHLHGAAGDQLLRVEVQCHQCGAVGPTRNDKLAAMQAFVEQMQTRH